MRHFITWKIANRVERKSEKYKRACSSIRDFRVRDTGQFRIHSFVISWNKIIVWSYILKLWFFILAYEILSDSKKRRSYDQFGYNFDEESRGNNFDFNFEDLFEQFKEDIFGDIKDDLIKIVDSIEVSMNDFFKQLKKELKEL